MCARLVGTTFAEPRRASSLSRVALSRLEALIESRVTSDTRTAMMVSQWKASPCSKVEREMSGWRARSSSRAPSRRLAQLLYLSGRLPADTKASYIYSLISDPYYYIIFILLAGYLRG